MRCNIYRIEKEDYIMILDDLAASTRKRIEEQKKNYSPTDIRLDVINMMEKETVESLRYFPFEKALSAPGLSIISEVKKASPSKGVIATSFPYLEIAKEYEASGADAISCSLFRPHIFTLVLLISKYA